MTAQHHPPQPAPSPWWLIDGLVVAGGWHPLPARIRRGIPSETVEADYDWEYSPEHVHRLKDLGITLLVGQFDRGLCDGDQAEDQQRARELAGLCHERGIRHGCYIANTVYFESMLKEHPDCETWVVRTHDGRFVHYGGQQTFRWVACFNAPGWRRRIERQIDRAIDFVGTDALHFDNLAVWPEPDSCHCPFCIEAFRGFLSHRYPTAAAQKRRFGFAASDFHTFSPPNFYLRFSPPWTVDRIDNPLMQEWLAFRQWTVTSYIAHMAAYARRRKPDILIDSNGQGVWGCNQAFIHGIDQAAQAEHVDVVWEENPDLRPDGDTDAICSVTHKFRGMNYHRGRGTPVLTAYRDEETLAFNLTFSGHPGINQQWGYAEPGRAALREPQPGVRQLLRHFQRNRSLYLNSRSAARVATWRNNQSLALVSTDTHLSACVMEQMLFDSRIPFRIISDEVLGDDRLSEFDLLIFPNVEFIAPGAIERITRYIDAGGSLLITEKSGAFTDEPRRRASWPFIQLFAHAVQSAVTTETEAATIDPLAQFESIERSGQPARASFGRGRIAYLPRIEYRHRPRTFASRYNGHFDGIDSRYWKRPGNHAQVMDTIAWLAPTARCVSVAGCDELRLDLVELADRTLAIPLLRCGHRRGQAQATLTLRTRTAPPQARLHQPERADPVDLTFVPCPDGVRTDLTLERHGMLTLNITRRHLGAPEQAATTPE